MAHDISCFSRNGIDSRSHLAGRPPSVEFGARPPGHFHEMLFAPQLWLLGLMQMATFGISVVVGSWVRLC